MAATFAVEAEFAGVGAGWTDITRDLANTVMRTQRGFQSAAPDDLLAAPTTWTFTLDNSVNNSGAKQGYYSPDHANLRSGFALDIRMRLKITANSTTRVRAFGWLEVIRPVAGKYEMQTTDCVVVGWFNQAASSSVAGLGAAIAQRPDQLIASVVALVPNAPAATSYATGLQTYPQSFHDVDTQTSTALDVLDSIVRSGGMDRLFEKADGTIRFETRQTRQTFTTPALTITDTPAVGKPALALMAMGLSRDRGKQYDAVKVTVHPKAIDASPVVLYALPISASTPSIPAGQSITFRAAYVDPTQQGQSAAGFNMLISDGAGGATIGTSGSLPVADYQFGASALGAGADLSSAMVVTVVYGTREATITVTNTGSVFTAFCGRLQCRGQGIYDYQNMQAQATVTSSVKNVLSIDCPYNADPFFAVSLAQYFAGNLSIAQSQLEQGIQVDVPADDELTMDALLQLEISNAITIGETVTGLTAGAYWINGEAMEIDERGNITFTYPLATNFSTVVWTIGVAGASELGQTSVLGV